MAQTRNFEFDNRRRGEDDSVEPNALPSLLPEEEGEEEEEAISQLLPQS